MKQQLSQYIKQKRIEKKLSIRELAIKINCLEKVMNYIEQEIIPFVLVLPKLKQIILVLDLTIPNILKETTFQNESALYQIMYPEYKEKDFDKLNKKEILQNFEKVLHPNYRHPIEDLIDMQHKLNNMFNQ